MGRRSLLFGLTVLLLMGCGPSVEKVVPDRAVQGDVIDLRDPENASLLVPGTVHFGQVQAPVVLSWEPEDVFVEVPPGLSGEVNVYLDINGFLSNPTQISILATASLLKVMCFGDSIVYQDVPESLQYFLDQHPHLGGLDPVVINQGKVAELVSHSMTRTRWSNALDFHDPDLAVLQEGTNDLRDDAMISLAEVQNSTVLMIDEALGEGVDLILCTLLPRVGDCGDVVSPTIEEYNTWLVPYAAGRGIPLVDLHQEFVSIPDWENEFFDASDCLHPNLEGATKIGELLTEKIEELYPAS
jgi:lysophospholipase L1-like esterase